MTIDNEQELDWVYANDATFVRFTSSPGFIVSTQMFVNDIECYVASITTNAEGKGFLQIDDILRSKMSYHPIDNDIVQEHTTETCEWKLILKDMYSTLTISKKAVLSTALIEGNFFLTRRTSSNTLVLHESEVGPLSFFYHLNAEFKFYGIDDYFFKLTELYKQHKIYAIDINGVRKFNLSESKTLSPIAIVTDASNDTELAKIIIIPDIPGTTILEFRNSFGQFDRLAVKIINEETKTENKTIYNRYVNGTATRRTARGSIIQYYNATTTYTNKDGLCFIKDLLLSDETYLYINGNRELVFISTTDKLSHIDTNPQAIDIKIELAEQIIN